MSSKTRTSLFAFLAVATILAVALTGHRSQTGKDQVESRQSDSGVSDTYLSEEIREIVFLESGLQIVRRDGGWDAVSRSNDIFPTDPDRIATIARLIGNPRILRPVPSADPGHPQYGLTNKTADVEITTKDGTTYSWIRGTKPPTGDGWYAKTDREDVVYIVDEEWGTVLATTPSDTHRSSLPEIEINSIQMMQVKNSSNGETVVLRKITNRDPAYPPTAYMEIDAPYNGVYAASTRRFRAIIDALSGYPIIGFLDPNDPISDLLLSNIEETSIALTNEDGHTTEYRFYTLDPGSYAGEAIVVVTRPESAIASPPAFIEAIPSILSDAKPYDYVDPLIMTPQYDDVREVRIEGSRTFILDRRGRYPTLNGRELTEERSKTLYLSIIDLRIDGEISASPAIGEPVVTITYTLKRGDQQLRIEACEYDDHFYALRRNGMVDFVTAKTAVEAMYNTVASIENALER